MSSVVILQPRITAEFVGLFFTFYRNILQHNRSGFIIFIFHFQKRINISKRRQNDSITSKKVYFIDLLKKDWKTIKTDNIFILLLLKW